MIIDSHCHLTYEPMSSSLDETIRRANNDGVKYLLTISTEDKSFKNILDPIEIIKNYGTDQLRYYLVKEVSLGNDGSISMQNLKNCINNDLANNYGNLCQRVFSFIKKNCSNKIPKPNKLNDSDLKLLI